MKEVMLYILFIIQFLMFTFIYTKEVNRNRELEHTIVNLECEVQEYQARTERMIQTNLDIYMNKVFEKGE